MFGIIDTIKTQFKVKSKSNVPIYPDITEYQHFILNNTSYFALNRQRIEKTPQGSYCIKSSSNLAHFLFYFNIFNTFSKVFYILYLLWSNFQNLAFLDKMSAVCYLLVFGILLIAYTIWLPRDPLYEILHRFWSIQKSIATKLGCSQKLHKKVHKRYKATVWVHLAISWIGCVCFVIQYNADPKYYTFTYSFFEENSSVLFILFGIHEFLFMLHAWNMMTGSNSLFTFQAISFSNIINEMTAVVRDLPVEGWVPNTMQDAMHTITGTTFTHPRHYNIDNLISDYKQLMLISELYNKWVGYKAVFLHACGYFQFISDVFLAVQVLKLEGTGVLDIWFYIEDSLASMYMIYRVYEFMSRVEPASREFFQALSEYVYKSSKAKRTEEKRIRKTIKTLKLVSLKIGPCPVTRSTVFSAMQILTNYYITVMLW